MEPELDQPQSRNLRRRRRIAITGVIVVVLFGALGAFTLSRQSSDTKPGAVASSSTTTTATTNASVSTAPLAPSPVSYRNEVATANVAQMHVYDDPSATQPSHTFSNPWLVNNDPNAKVPLVFLVLDKRDNWIEVLLPIRPNGSKGWVKASTVTVQPNPFHINVKLGEHAITVYNGDQQVVTDTVAVGAPETPTPQGLFYIRALLKSPNPSSVYGPYAYGLSGYSEVLEEFSGGDAEVGIHGNNDASVLGQDVSHGCVRMSNEKITQLVSMLPLGTAVVIEA